MAFKVWQIMAAKINPTAVEETDRIKDSSINIQSTFDFCIPIARKVPISVVLSLTDIHKALIKPMAMIIDKTIVKINVSALRRLIIHFKKEVSSSQVVISRSEE